MDSGLIGFAYERHTMGKLLTMAKNWLAWEKQFLRVIKPYRVQKTKDKANIGLRTLSPQGLIRALE